MGTPHERGAHDSAAPRRGTVAAEGVRMFTRVSERTVLLGCLMVSVALGCLALGMLSHVAAL